MTFHTSQPFAWQQKIWRFLIDAHLKNRLSHAYLIAGQRGYGRRALCKAFAHILLCQNLSKKMEACGHCTGCNLNKANSHPDLLFIDSEEDEFKLSQIKIDQIRHILDFSHKMAHQGGKRIVIINSVNTLNLNAANALLKTLEEPGSDTFFFLIANAIHNVLPTIRSRCQLLTLIPPEENFIKKWLTSYTEEDNLSENDIQLILDFSENAPLRAYSLIQLNKRDLIMNALAELKNLSKGTRSVSQTALVWLDLKPEFCIDWLLNWACKIIHYKTTGEVKYLYPQSIFDILQYVSNKNTLSALFKFYDWLLKQKGLIKQRINVNPQLLIESFLARWVDLIVASKSK